MRTLWLLPALLAAGVAVPLPAAAAPARALAGDFNGDGYGDLAIGAPEEAVGGAGAAGAVNVVYGSATGLRPARSQQWHQNVPGVPGVAEAGDRFGSAVASGDFDGDGYADLAIAAHTEHTSEGWDHGPRSNGVVHVLYGSATGLTTAGTDLWARGFEGAGAGATVLYGHALAVGDFDVDGTDDLAIGVPGDLNAGAVDVLRGGVGGLTLWRRFAPERENTPYDLEPAGYGFALAAGDFNGDAIDDLAVGAPYREITDGGGTVRKVPNAGEVVVLFGAAGTGLSTTDSVEIDQDSPGVDDGAEQSDRFGAGLGAGDFDGDGKDDLVVGVPGEAVGGSTARIGAFHVLPGSPNGPSGAGSTFWHRNGGGLPGGPTANTGVGTAFATGDLDEDGRADLAVGAGLDDIGAATNAGSVTAVYGSVTGLSTTRMRLWHQNVAGVPGIAETGDWFGHAVAMRDLNKDGRAELAVGAPRESFDGAPVGGQVTVLRGGTAAGVQVWHQDVAGVPGEAERGDWFGASVG